MAVTFDQFLKQLHELGILPPEAIQECLPLDGTQDVDALARDLVRRKKLTKFQADQLWQGKGKSLVLGNYLLLEKIGSGGMGQVFKALHLPMQRVVAAKVLPPHVMKEKSAVARFEREAQAAARINHPNIVKIYDALQVGNIHFFAMEYVDGSDLANLVKKGGPLSVARSTDYILQAARGLGAIHAAGVVHRDIKPSNLLLDNNGVVKILDMGLARIDAGSNQAELTATGAIMGTVDFMAPEQALNTKAADARADIYSLGCTLYFLLTGRSTYEGSSLMAKLMAHRDQPIPVLQSHVPDASDALADLFRKMVAKQVGERYQTVAEVIADLERLHAPSSLHIQPPSPPADDDLARFLKDLPQQPAVRDAPAGPDVPRKLLVGGGTPANSKRLVRGIAGGVAALLIVIVLIHLATRRSQPAAAGSRRENVAADTAAVAAAKSPARLANQQPLSSEGAAAASAVKSSQAPRPAPAAAVAPFDAAQARKHQAAWAEYLNVPVEIQNSLKMKLVLIPPGEFTMGSPPADIAAALVTPGNGDAMWQEFIRSEAARKVVLTKPVYMGMHEVTQQEYTAVMQRNPSRYTKPGTTRDVVAGLETTNFPVVSLNWFDAAEFCEKLSERENRSPLYRRSGGQVSELAGTGYRLPTEAEWEFACRAGTTTTFFGGDGEDALARAGWFDGNSEGRPHAVGERPANPFGLFDMHGNVWEWLQDGWDPGYYRRFTDQPAVDPSIPFANSPRRMIHGGHWDNNSSRCRCATRFAHEARASFHSVGFRVVLVIPERAN